MFALKICPPTFLHLKFALLTKRLPTAGLDQGFSTARSGNRSITGRGRFEMGRDPQWDLKKYNKIISCGKKRVAK
jgi:hypothetical protein